MAPEPKKQDKNPNTETSRKAGSKPGGPERHDQGPNRPQEDDDDRDTREGRDQGRLGGSSRE